MAVNHLLLTDPVKEEQEDDLLASLTSIAYKTPIPEAPKIKTKKKKKVGPVRKSHFFFKPTESFNSEFAKRRGKKGKTPDTAITILDREVEERGVAYSKELPEALLNNIESVREFFLQELGPLALAAQAGTVQAGQVLQKTLNTEIDDRPFVQFKQMVSKASSIKMARFIAQYLSLPPRTANELYQTTQPAQPREVLFMHNSPLEEQRRPPKAKPEPVAE
jgi:hypothetical protein